MNEEREQSLHESPQLYIKTTPGGQILHTPMKLLFQDKEQLLQDASSNEALSFEEKAKRNLARTKGLVMGPGDISVIRRSIPLGDTSIPIYSPIGFPQYGFPEKSLTFLSQNMVDNTKEMEKIHGILKNNVK